MIICAALFWPLRFPPLSVQVAVIKREHGVPAVYRIAFLTHLPEHFPFQPCKGSVQFNYRGTSSSMVLAWDSMISLCFGSSPSARQAVPAWGPSPASVYLLSLSFNILFDCIKVVKTTGKASRQAICLQIFASVFSDRRAVFAFPFVCPR